MPDMPTAVDQQAMDQHVPARHLSEEQMQLWRAWLRAQLIRHQYAALGPGNKVRYYLSALARDIPEALRRRGEENPTPVSIETLRNVIYRSAIPTHNTARGLAAVFGISEIAILLRSGQLDWDAVTPLLGPAPALLRSEEEHQRTLERLQTDMPDPAFRAQIANLLDREWRFSQWLAAKLRWLGISEAEWEAIRQDLNSPAGRRRLSRALFAPDAATDHEDNENDEDDPALPDEFFDRSKNTR